MSSKTRTSGCVWAISCAHSRAAQAISCWLRSPWTASSTPVARPSRSATASAGQHSRSFSSATSSGSSSAMPADALDHLRERPVRDALAVGRQRPTSTVVPSTESRNSRARRLLPTPGLAVDREEMRPPVAQGSGERVLEELELGVPADERRIGGAAGAVRRRPTTASRPTPAARGRASRPGRRRRPRCGRA